MYVRSLLAASALALGLFVAATPAPAGDGSATYQDIEKTLGLVPGFFKVMSDTAVPGAWEEMKGLQMNPGTALPGRTKELIGLAVAAQIPCEYCIIYHTEAARGAGATDQQIQEAVGMAAVTRESSTLFNGLQIDKTQFRKDLDRLMQGPHQAKK